MSAGHMTVTEERPTHADPRLGGDGIRIPAVGFCPECGSRDQFFDEITRMFGCPHCGARHDDRKGDAG